MALVRLPVSCRVIGREELGGVSRGLYHVPMPHRVYNTTRGLVMGFGNFGCLEYPDRALPTGPGFYKYDNSDKATKSAKGQDVSRPPRPVVWAFGYTIAISM